MFLFCLLSTLTNVLIKTIFKPSFIIKYNKFMGGVSKCDQFLSYYLIGGTSMKWWKCIFYRLLELSVVNAMVIYFHKNPELKKETVSENPFVRC